MRTSHSLRAVIVFGIGALAGSLVGASSHVFSQAKAMAQRAEQSVRAERREIHRAAGGGRGYGFRNKYRETMAQQQRRSRKERNRMRHKAHTQGR